jgi:benzoyl-CoA reductase subunit BamC
MAKIIVDHKKCIGCRTCESACALKHAENVLNAKKSRIKIFEVGPLFLPVFAGPYTEAACSNRRTMNFEGVEVDECIICPASCPAKPVFKDPDGDIAIKCDLCGEPPDPECCKVCLCGAITFVDDKKPVGQTAETAKK